MKSLPLRPMAPEPCYGHLFGIFQKMREITGSTGGLLDENFQMLAPCSLAPVPFPLESVRRSQSRERVSTGHETAACLLASATLARKLLFLQSARSFWACFRFPSFPPHVPHFSVTCTLPRRKCPAARRGPGITECYPRFTGPATA